MPKKEIKKQEPEKLSAKEITMILKEIKEILERKKKGYVLFGQIVKQNDKGLDIKSGAIVANTSRRHVISSILNSLEMEPAEVLLSCLSIKNNSRNRRKN